MPSAERQMSRRRTCCCSSDNNYPCQPCPESPKEWTLYVTATGIINDSAGSGLLWPCLDFRYPSCAIAGSCGRQTYRRKAVGNTDFMGTICESEICESIIDESAPTASGSHLMKWDWCPGTDRPDCDFVTSGGIECGANVEDNQDGAVNIDGIYPDAHWNFTTCARDYPAENNECVTLISVTYTYSDSFLVPRWDTIEDACVSDDFTFYPTTASIGGYPNVAWVCIYGRRVAPGQFFAEGSYQLLRCEYPAAYRTYLPTGNDVCVIEGGVACASSWGNSPNIPTTWKPPSSINLTRSV